MQVLENECGFEGKTFEIREHLGGLAAVVERFGVLGGG